MSRMVRSAILWRGLQKRANRHWCRWTFDVRTIDAVGVFNLPFIYSEVPYGCGLAEMKKSAQQAVDHAAEQLRKLKTNVQTHVVERNHAGDALVEFAKKRGSDIIVLGKSSHDLFGRSILGSTSRYVLSNSKCSIWIARKSPL